ncbi:MAG: RNA signal recognition particle 4.5S RNA, partial [uncultured Solirubrobacterales bacterium]
GGSARRRTPRRRDRTARSRRRAGRPGRAAACSCERSSQAVGLAAGSITPTTEGALPAPLRRWIRTAGPRRQARRLPRHRARGGRDLARARRARGTGVRRRRREGGRGHLLPGQRPGRAGRDGGIRVDPVRVARAPRPRERRGDGGPALQGDDDPGGDARRRPAHDLRRLQRRRGGV